MPLREQAINISKRVAGDRNTKLFSNVQAEKARDIGTQFRKNRNP